MIELKLTGSELNTLMEILTDTWVEKEITRTMDLVQIKDYKTILNKIESSLDERGN